VDVRIRIDAVIAACALFADVTIGIIITALRTAIQWIVGPGNDRASADRIVQTRNERQGPEIDGGTCNHKARRATGE